jgi:hypothetical protein
MTLHILVERYEFFRELDGLYTESRSEADRPCGLVVRVPGYRSKGSGFDSWHYQIF